MTVLLKMPFTAYNVLKTKAFCVSNLVQDTWVHELNKSL